MFVLDAAGSALVIKVDDVPGGGDHGDGPAWLDAGEAVVRTFEFAQPVATR